MNKKVHYWILIALSKAPKWGYDAVKLYHQRPDFLDVQFDKFFNLLRELENEDFIKHNKKTLSLSFFLTEKGEKEVRKFYHPSNIKSFYELLRYFPELELKDRIENIESFIFSTIFLFLSLYFITKRPFKNTYFLLFLLGVFMTSLVNAASYFSVITHLVLEKFTFISKSKIIDLYEDNRNSIGYFLVLLFTVVGLVTLEYLGLTYVQLVIAVILQAIFWALLNIEKIKDYFKTRKLKIRSRD